MNDYVKNMRCLVGHRPLLLAGANLLVINNGNILLQRRIDNGLWAYHGGCIELGETLEENAMRELHEETGLTALSLKLWRAFSGKSTHYIYPNGDEVFAVDIVYICNSFEGKMRTDNIETCELRWFPINELPENISPPDINTLHCFQTEYASGKIDALLQL